MNRLYIYIYQLFLDSLQKNRVADVENNLRVAKGEGSDGQIRRLELTCIHYCI